MSILHDAYAALLSGLTNETADGKIHWVDHNNDPIVIDVINIEREQCIISSYYEDGQKYWERNYDLGELHGTVSYYYENGQKHWKENYSRGRLHGISLAYHSNGQKHWERNYNQGKSHGVVAYWDLNGDMFSKNWYEQGRFIKASHCP